VPKKFLAMIELHLTFNDGTQALAFASSQNKKEHY
jgi:hypothetical protein